MAYQDLGLPTKQLNKLANVLVNDITDITFADLADHSQVATDAQASENHFQNQLHVLMSLTQSEVRTENIDDVRAILVDLFGEAGAEGVVHFATQKASPTHANHVIFAIIAAYNECLLISGGTPILLDSAFNDAFSSEELTFNGLEKMSASEDWYGTDATDIGHINGTQGAMIVAKAIAEVARDVCELVINDNTARKTERPITKNGTVSEVLWTGGADTPNSHGTELSVDTDRTTILDGGSGYLEGDVAGGYLIVKTDDNATTAFGEEGQYVVPHYHDNELHDHTATDPGAFRPHKNLNDSNRFVGGQNDSHLAILGGTPEGNVTPEPLVPAAIKEVMVQYRDLLDKHISMFPAGAIQVHLPLFVESLNELSVIGNGNVDTEIGITGDALETINSAIFRMNDVLSHSVEIVTEVVHIEGNNAPEFENRPVHMFSRDNGAGGTPTIISATATDMRPIDEEFFLDITFRLNADSDFHRPIIGGNGGADDGWIGFDLETGNGAFVMVDDGGIGVALVPLDTGINVKDGDWHRMVVSSEAGEATVTVMIDDVIQGGGERAISSNNTIRQQNHFGASTADGLVYFEGQVAHMYVQTGYYQIETYLDSETATVEYTGTHARSRQITNYVQANWTDEDVPFSLLP